MNMSRPAAAIVLLLLAGCAATTTSFFDPDSGAAIVRTSGNRLAGGLTSVELNAQRFDKGDTPSYSLIILYTGPTFADIGPGRTLALTIDGQRHELAGQGSGKHRTMVSIGLVEEKAFYHDLDPAFFNLLASATEVEIEVTGTGKTLNRHFRTKNFNHFRMFYDHQVLRSGDGTGAGNTGNK